jgi:hypothetical protein
VLKAVQDYVTDIQVVEHLIISVGIVLSAMKLQNWFFLSAYRKCKCASNCWCYLTE